MDDDTKLRIILIILFVLVVFIIIGVWESFLRPIFLFLMESVKITI